MSMLEITLVTDDEQFSPERWVAEQIKMHLLTMRMDTYNKRYVVKVTVDEVAPTLRDPDDA